MAIQRSLGTIRKDTAELGPSILRGAEGQNLPEPGGQCEDYRHLDGKLSPVANNGGLGGPAHPKQSEPLSPESPHRPLLITAIPTIMPKAPSFLDVLLFFSLNLHNTAFKNRNYHPHFTEGETEARGGRQLSEMTQPGLAQGSPTTQPILSTLRLCWSPLSTSLLLSRLCAP